MIVYALFHFAWHFPESEESKFIGIFSDLTTAKQHADGAINADEWKKGIKQWDYTLESSPRSGNWFTIYYCTLDKLVNADI